MREIHDLFGFSAHSTQPAQEAAATIPAGTERAQSPSKSTLTSIRENLRRPGCGEGRTNTPYFSDTPLPQDAAWWQRRGAFLDKWTQKGPDCWEWTGFKNQSGYGLVCFRVDGRTTTRGAHRLQWQRFFGPPPEGRVVMHECDNPGCVNPKHLKIGTPQENVEDMRTKGRANISGLRNQK